jgi:hypothetical protein
MDEKVIIFMTMGSWQIARQCAFNTIDLIKKKDLKRVLENLTFVERNFFQKNKIIRYEMLTITPGYGIVS